MERATVRRARVNSQPGGEASAAKEAIVQVRAAMLGKNARELTAQEEAAIAPIPAALHKLTGNQRSADRQRASRAAQAAVPVAGGIGEGGAARPVDGDSRKDVMGIVRMMMASNTVRPPGGGVVGICHRPQRNATGRCKVKGCCGEVAIVLSSSAGVVLAEGSETFQLMADGKHALTTPADMKRGPPVIFFPFTHGQPADTSRTPGLEPGNLSGLLAGVFSTCEHFNSWQLFHQVIEGALPCMSTACEHLWVVDDINGTLTARRVCTGTRYSVSVHVGDMHKAQMKAGLATGQQYSPCFFHSDMAVMEKGALDLG